MNTIIAVAAGIVAMLLMGNVWADEAENPWKGNISLGYLASTGNTETQSFNGEVKAAYSVDGWVHNLLLATVGSRDAGETTAERYQAQYKLDKMISEKSYLFGRLAFDKDRFSGFDSKASGVAGLGHHLVENENHLLKAELGAGSRHEELLDGTSNTNAIFLGNVDYLYRIGDNAEFTQTLLLEAGKDNNYSESVSKVRSNLIGALSIAITYTIKHNSNPPMINQKTDTYTAISVEYKF